MILTLRFKVMNENGNFLNGAMLWRNFIKMKKFDKRIFKKSPEELQEYLQFKRRGSKVEPKKGKGSYKRNNKHKNHKYV